MFSTDPKSICAAIFGWLNITTIPTEFKAKLWHSNMNNIAIFIQVHQNNVIEKCKGLVESKYTQLI